MAGDWIKVQTCTPDKPEVHLIAEHLAIDPDAVTGKLIRIWCWADQQTADGNADSVTKSLLDRVSGVTGFANALISVGWLMQTDTGFCFPNFDRHNGNSAKTRAASAKRVEKHRKTAGSDVTVMKRKCNADSVTTALPEKRREEKRRNKESQIVADATMPVSKPKSDVAPIQYIADQFVAAFGGRLRITANRIKAANTRWRDEWWRNHWQEALDRGSSSAFLQGENDTGWKCDIDWFLKPDSVAKILEGKYDGIGTSRRRETAAERREQLNATSFDIIRQAAAAANRQAELAASSHQRLDISPSS